MILSDKEVFEYINKPCCKEELDKLKKECKEYRAYTTGKDFLQYLPDLPQFERDELREERRKMALSTVDVVSRVLKPRNRIFSAKGGSEHFIITNPKDEKEFREIIEKITQGLSIKSWIQQVVLKRNDYDPNGIILVEIDPDKNVYPCFKSIIDIHDRQLNGRTPEYLILKLSKTEIKKLKNAGVIPKSVQDSTEIFRVIDDARDLICNKSKIIAQIPSFSAPKFPGIVSSNIYGDEDDIFYSPLHDVYDLLKQYLLRSSLYNVVFARQAYPKEWMQKTTCPTCEGTGQLDSLVCPECNGTKVLLSLKHSDVFIADWGDDANKSVPTPPMGNIEAPIDTLEFFDGNLEGREDKIHYGIWGMYKSDKISSIHAGVTRDTIGSNVEPTAYQAMLNAQPMVTQLVEFSKWYVGIYGFIADIVGKYKFPSTYMGSSILGGDRFMIESPDATWDRYLKAVKSLAPTSELDSILIEYIENKYCNNTKLYNKYILLMGVEPFLHAAVADVLLWDIPVVQKMEKIYFSEWKNSLTDWNFTAIAYGLGEFEEQEPDDIEDDDSEQDDESGMEKVDPVKNLKDNLRDWTLQKMKDNASLDKPMIMPDGSIIPMNSIIFQPPKQEPQTAN